jgi:hypothetical protein
MATKGILRRVRRRRARRLVGALAVLVLAMAGCGNSGDDSDSDATTPPTTSGSTDTTEATDSTAEFVPLPDVSGVTDDEIRFAAFGTNSNNPLGTCVLDCFVDGIEAYFAFRNDQGGVHGRELVVSKVLDDELAQNQVRALEIVSADDTFGAFSATQVASGWADIATAGIPLYVWAIHFNEMNGRDSIFGNSGVVCGTCTTRSNLYAVSQAGGTRVAAFGYGVSQNSKDCANGIARSIEMYGAETGLEVAYLNDNLEFGLGNGVAPEVTAMKDNNVDFVMTCIDLNGMKTFAQEMERQGLGDVKMLHSNTYNQQFVAEAGDLFEGDVVSVGFRPFEADPGDSALGDFLEWMDKTGSDLTELAMQGWINADLAYQGLVEAGPNFDRAKVIAATNTMTEYSAGGLINPIDWTRQHEPATQDDPTTHGYAQECTAYVSIAGGEFTVVGDAAKPWVCWSNSSRDWAEPVATNFD